MSFRIPAQNFHAPVKVTSFTLARALASTAASSLISSRQIIL